MNLNMKLLRGIYAYGFEKPVKSKQVLLFQLLKDMILLDNHNQELVRLEHFLLVH